MTSNVAKSSLSAEQIVGGRLELFDLNPIRRPAGAIDALPALENKPSIPKIGVLVATV